MLKLSIITTDRKTFDLIENSHSIALNQCTKEDYINRLVSLLGPGYYVSGQKFIYRKGNNNFLASINF